MKKKKPILTYIISFLNPIIPTFIVVFIGGLFVMYTTFDTDTNEVTSKITFIELFYPLIIFSIYFGMLISLLHYYFIRKGIFRPRWWLNVLLIIFAYSIIPLSAYISVLISGLPTPVENKAANSIVIGNYFYSALLSVAAFILITIITREKSNQGMDPTR